MTKTQTIKDRLDNAAAVAANPTAYTAAEREEVWIEAASVALAALLKGWEGPAMQVAELCGQIMEAEA